MFLGGSMDKQHVLEIIENNLDKMTDLEKEIAQYFLKSQNISDDLSSFRVSQHLHISQAALTRFAKKCGFIGYREFKFQYQQQISEKRKNLLLHITIYHDESYEITHKFEFKQKR